LERAPLQAEDRDLACRRRAGDRSYAREAGAIGADRAGIVSVSAPDREVGNHIVVEAHEAMQLDSRMRSWSLCAPKPFGPSSASMAGPLP